MTDLLDGARLRRLAVYGFIDEHAGSQASASYTIVQSILQAGHQVDLYAIAGFITPGQLDQYSNFRYVPVQASWCVTVWAWLKKVRPRRVRDVLEFGFAKASAFLHNRQIKKRLFSAQQATPYDALLSFGLLSPWRLPHAKTISWPQGPPNGEFSWILRNWRQLVSKLGFFYLLFLILLYTTKCCNAKFAQRKSDVIIGGSRWTVSMWNQLGVPADRLFALPYPVNLTQFVTAPIKKDLGDDRSENSFCFLHLGRLVPRKRLDLLLAAFEIVQRVEPDTRLLIVGSFSYATAYRSTLLERLPCASIEYQERVARAEIPNLIGGVDAVIQTGEHEDFGSAIAEALACGKPVVLGPTNGTGDYLPECCSTFKQYNAQSVSEAMLTTIQRVRIDKSKMTAACRQAAEKWFAARTISNELLAHVWSP